MSDPNPEQLYRFYPAIVTPAILVSVAVYFGIVGDDICFAAGPCIIVGAFCATPNLNLIDGCLAYVAMILGFAIMQWVHPPLGATITVGTALGFYGAALEKWLFMRPVK